MSRIIYLTLVLSFYSTASLFAQGSTVQALLFEPSALLNAMGGCGTVQLSNTFDDFSNPAALAFQRQCSVGLIHKTQDVGLGDRSQVMLELNCPVGKHWGFALSALVYNEPNINQVSKWGTIERADMGGYSLFSISAGRELATNLAVGMRLSYCLYSYSSYYEHTTDGKVGYNPFYTGAVSILARRQLPISVLTDARSESAEYARDYPFIPESGMRFGFSLENIGPKVSMRSQAYSQPLKCSLGALYTPIHLYNFSLCAALEFESQPLSTNVIDFTHFGLRCIALHSVSIIGGATLAMNSNVESYFSYGLAFDGSWLHMCFARSYAFHSVIIQGSLSIAWGD